MSKLASAVDSVSVGEGRGLDDLRFDAVLRAETTEERGSSRLCMLYEQN